MILTTTQNVEGKKVIEYLGIVAGQDTYNPSGLIGEGWTKGAGNTYLSATLKRAQEAMSDAATALGADAVIGITSNASLAALSGGRVIVYISGTAVKLDDDEMEDELPTL